MFVWHSRELNNVFGDGNMNFDKFKEEHCCNKFCSYYGLQPFSLETSRVKDAPTSPGPLSKFEGNSFPKNPMGFDISSSWNGGVADDIDDIADIEQKGKDAARTAGGYTKWMDLSP